ncbi:MAG: helix-turn-helix domain-containing protein [Bacteroides sp.]|nr:helix-turn-helix domain-containing protein [Bacteroides sp.]MCM1084969.1 helix-turn-helix domain-containing protein [Bacteroides sp.]
MQNERFLEAGRGYVEDDAVVLDSLRHIVDYQVEGQSDMVLMALCTRGRAVFVVDGKIHKAVRGSLVLLRPGSVVKFEELTARSEGIGIGFTQKFVQGAIVAYRDLWALLMGVQDNPEIRLEAGEIKDIARIHRHLYEACLMPPHAFKSEMLHSYMQGLIYQVALVVSMHVKNIPVGNSRHFELYYRFMQLVEQYCRQSRQVAFYADKLYVSPKYLGMAVKSVSGKTANRWIDEYVTGEVKKMLRNTTATIRQISDHFNFPDASFFTKYFKKNAGMSPKEYRLRSGR